MAAVKKFSFTKEQLLFYFEYDRENGELIWINKLSRANISILGKKAGTIDKNGYRMVCLKYRKYLIHRLIWFIEEGTYPEMIDHINGNKIDNRKINLRASNQRENLQNMHMHRNGKLVGTCFCKTRGNWNSIITFNKKRKFLGSFSTELEAHQAYVKALKEYENAK